jgi:riboflavin synthase
MSGHIDSQATVADIELSENNKFISYSVTSDKMKYIFDKGFVGLNGCSLTVANVDKENNTFKICYIPETLRATTHGDKQLDDCVNLEVDRQTQTIVDTVEAYLSTHAVK